MKMLDLFCGLFGWSKAFAARGWECVGIDLVEPPEIPDGCTFLNRDILELTPEWIQTQGFDFICASSPCEQFSVHGTKHFHPNPPYPALGMELFNHTRKLCEASGLPYIMENVRAAQAFVGYARHHCGPFYLWGNAVPLLMAQGIRKGADTGGALSHKPGVTRAEFRAYRKEHDYRRNGRKQGTAQVAVIPPELSTCVCDYAEYLVQGCGR